MANNVPQCETVVQNEKQVTLCDTVKEILDLICCYHNNKDNAGCTPEAMEDLELSIHVKKKSGKTKDKLDVFTIKVKCNQYVPMISSLKEMKSSKLIDFIGQMQMHEEESHMAIRLPDHNDPNLMRTFGLWISLHEDSTTHLQIREETLSRTTQVKEKLLMQLRIFLTESVLMTEVQSMSRLICCLKMVNSSVSIRLSLEGIFGEELDLSNKECISCESLNFSMDSNLYNHIALLDNDIYEYDMSLSKTFYANMGDASSFSGFCGLIFLPRFVKDKSQCQVRSSTQKRGEIFITIQIQIYDSNRQPLDMLELCLHYQITPDVLIPSNDFNSILRITGTSSIAPYNMGCCVELMQDSSLPKFILECDKFAIRMCYILNEDFSYSDPMTNGFLNFLKESSHVAFRKLLHVDEQKDSEQQLASSKKDCDHDDSVKRWITDIATALSDIYIRSTDISFRARVAQMAPVHTCLSMKAYLQESLETILLNNSGLNDVQPSIEHIGEYKSTEDEWKEMSLSQFSCNEDRPEGSMSPDSLDDMMEHEWNDLSQENPHRGETKLASVSQSRSYDFSHHNEWSVQGDIAAMSLPELPDSSFHMHHDENVHFSELHQVRQDESAVQTQSTIRSKSIQSGIKSATYCDTSHKDEAFDLVTELTVWKTAGDLIHNVNGFDEVKNEYRDTFNKNESNSTESDSFHGDQYAGVKHVETVSLMKRSNTMKLAFNFDNKKVKIDDGVLK